MAKAPETSYVKEWMDALGRWFGLAGQADEKTLVAMISEKSASMAESLRFSPDQKLRIESSCSRDELLLCVRETVLPKLARLGGVGFLSEESVRAIAHLDEKIGRVLDAKPSGEAPPAKRTDELIEENAELKERIERLHVRYIETDLPPETASELRERIKSLSATVDDQRARLSIAKKKIETLLSSREMIRDFRIKMGVLQSRLDYQTELIQALTANNREHRELVSRIDGLLDENRQLKMELDRQADLLGQLQQYLPPDSWRMVEELINKNQTLRTRLEETDAELEGAFAKPENRENLIEYLDKLSEENIYLKNMRDTKQSIDDFIRNEGKGNADTIIERLKLENQRLEIASDSRRRQVEYVEAPLADRPLLKAYTRLREERRQLSHENQFKDQLYKHQEDEKTRLIAQAREKTTLIKENQRLKADMAARDREWDDLLKKALKESRTMGMELSKMRARHDEALNERDALTRELVRLTAEHKMLLAQLESFFARRE
jgi:hypothetical protein